MKLIQKSFNSEDEAGKLYIVATPIGNLEDMTFRAIKILKEVDLIAAEDTRNTIKLLNHFEISTALISYHEHNEISRGEEIIEKLKSGKNIALVSDAGMPIISDPGYPLLVAALEAGIPVVPLPGANAALTALVASGIAPQPFYFHGFLPRKRKEKEAALESLAKIPATLILYESPHRLKETLADLEKMFGDRDIALCRELTKRYEEFLRGTISDAIQWADKTQLRGEFCLIISRSEQAEEEEEAWWSDLSLDEHVEFYIKEDKKMPREAIKLVARDRKLARRDVYNQYHNL